jgi:hypothetical protein
MAPTQPPRGNGDGIDGVSAHNAAPAAVRVRSSGGPGHAAPDAVELATVVARVIVASIGTRRRTVSDRMLPTRLPDALRMLRPLRAGRRSRWPKYR